LESDYNRNGSVDESEIGKDIIKVRAKLSCPSCSYKKSFMNQFHQKDLESMVVSLKCFDWLACSCGDLLDLNLEFQI